MNNWSGIYIRIAVQEMMPEPRSAMKNLPIGDDLDRLEIRELYLLKNRIDGLGGKREILEQHVYVAVEEIGSNVNVNFRGCNVELQQLDISIHYLNLETQDW